MFKRKFIPVLVATMMFFIVVSNSIVHAEPDYEGQKNEKIQKNEDRMNELKDRNEEIYEIQNKIKGDINYIQNKLQEKSQELQKSQDEINLYEVKIEEMNNKVNYIESEMTRIQGIIDLKLSEIAEKEREGKEKQEILGKRLRGMYINNPTDTIVKIILDSGNFSDLLSRIANISRLIKNDQQLIDEVVKLRKELEEDKKRLEGEKKSLKSKKSSLNNEKKVLEDTKQNLLAVKRSNESIVNELNDMESSKQGLIAKLDNEKGINEKEIQDLSIFNDDLQRQIEEDIKSKADKGKENQNGNYNTTGFIKPVNGPITSPFGPRIHPVTRARGFHHGVDFGVGYGTTIKAAQGGQVVYAGWHAVYGKMVIISHGNGIQTAYAHASSLSVSVGQAVEQGQEVAKVGSTGMSTGPHLHFEVRINGSVVDPMGYL